MPNFRLSNSPNFYLDRFLLLKVYKTSAKKVKRSMSHDTVKWWKPNCCFKNDKKLVNLMQALKSRINLHFDWFLSCKAYNVWPEKSTEEVHFMTLRSHSKFEKKMPWGLKNDMRNLGNFHRRLEMSKLVFSWDLFIQSRKCMT